MSYISRVPVAAPLGEWYTESVTAIVVHTCKCVRSPTKIEISCCFSIDEGDVSILSKNFAFSLVLSISVRLIVNKMERQKVRSNRYPEHLSLELSEKN